MSIEEEAREKADAAYHTATPNPLDPFNPTDAFRHGFEEGYIAGASRPVEATPSDTDRAALDRAVGEVLWNVANYPKRAQAPLLGANTAPLKIKVMDAVLAAGFSRSQPVQVEVTDEAVEALQVAIEVEHRYTPVMMLSIEDTERRECECGEHFLSAESHRYHVYRAALSAALRVGGERDAE